MAWGPDPSARRGGDGGGERGPDVRGSGKDKTAVELRKRGWVVSASMVGRILADAKRRGIIREPPATRRPPPQ